MGKLPTCRRAVLASALLWLTTSIVAAPSGAAVRPSIVLILTDDMAYDDVLAVPRTVALVGEAGATFTSAFVDVALCCPSRTTILTGRYPQNTHVYANNAPSGDYEAARRAGNEQSTMATWLQAGGYRTGYVGKYLNGYPGKAGERHVPPGWSHWVAPLGEPYEQYAYTLNIDGELEVRGRRPSDYLDDVLKEKALGFLAEALADERPFLLHLALVSPHEPAAAARRHGDLHAAATIPRTPSLLEKDVSDKPLVYRQPAPTRPEVATLEAGYRQRLRSLAGVDETVEAIVESLRAAGRLESTYVLFTSDNGFKLGHHQLGRGKQTEFEEDIHVPLMVRGPGIRPGTTIEALVSNADVAPSFADWADTSPDRPVDGRSLAPLLAGDGEPRPWRRSLLLARRPNDRQAPGTYREERGLFAGVTNVIAPAFRGLRSTRYLFTEHSTGERQLYDMEVDPFQLENLAGKAAPGVEGALADRARALESCAGETCRRLEDEPLPGS